MSIEDLYNLFLQRKNAFTDSRQAAHGGIFFALKGDRFDGNDFAVETLNNGANYAVVDRLELKDNRNCIYVNDVLTTLQQLANFHRKQLTIPIIGITGTNGKTTSKELIASVLSQNFSVLATKGNLNNHIGVPLTLLSITENHQLAIIEMGANHPGEIEFLSNIAEPDYGLITNVGKAHLEGFGSFEGVKKTKGELYRYIAQYGKGIFINADNSNLVEMAAENKVQFTYGIQNKNAELKGEVANHEIQLVAKVLFPKGWLYLKSNLTGSYNLENILAAVRIGLHFNIDPLQIQCGIETYMPSNNRSQITHKRSNLLLVDCYNANPSSMEVSINNFIQQRKKGKVIILGDMLELGETSLFEHQKIVNMLNYQEIEKVFLVGKNFLKTSTSENFIKVEKTDELKPLLEKYGFENKFFLIKGSRGIQLEKAIEMI
jgi:UDP-N-acetylmuramoyl-tripeptide--D-alanyl-D-alanine ligase